MRDARSEPTDGGELLAPRQIRARLAQLAVGRLQLLDLRPRPRALLTQSLGKTIDRPAHAADGVATLGEQRRSFILGAHRCQRGVDRVDPARDSALEHPAGQQHEDGDEQRKGRQDPQRERRELLADGTQIVAQLDAATRDVLAEHDRFTVALHARRAGC